MNKIECYKLFFLVLGTAALTGCGSKPVKQPEVSNNVAYEVSEDYITGVIRYTVQRGDRLGDIAQEFTGLATNWREIADFNNISNARNLRAGSVLEIPTDLIPGYQNARTVVEEPQPQRAAVITPSNSLALKRQPTVQVVTPEEVAPVVVTPIETNRNFDLNPIDTQATNGSAGSSIESGARQVTVIGSYYPKGIYSEPAPYSKLVMRVAPGTKFLLERQVNDWYKIVTNAGPGYIRTSDAELQN